MNDSSKSFNFVNRRECARLLEFLRLGSGFDLLLLKLEDPAMAPVVFQVLQDGVDDCELIELDLANAEPSEDITTPILEAARKYAGHPRYGLFMFGFDHAIGSQGERTLSLEILNEHRDLIAARLNRPLIMVLRPAQLQKLRQRAPDLWSIRSSIFDFPISPREVSLLHFSDLRFGSQRQSGLDSALEGLGDDLRHLSTRYEVQPDLVVITGDLSDSGKPHELEQALAFIDRVASQVALGRDRVVVVPGNHDVNWDACRAYFLSCQADDVDPQPPFWPKWQNFAGMFSELGSGRPGVEFTVAHPWTLFVFSELKVVVAGMNSTMASRYGPDRYGWLGEQQLRWFAEHLEPYRERGWLRIGALHHNLRPHTPYSGTLRDTDSLSRLLGQHLNLVLHGNPHDGQIDWLATHLPVIATRGTEYQIVQVQPNRIARWARCYDPDSGRWIRDSRAKADGESVVDEQPVRLIATSRTFPNVIGSTDDAVDYRRRDDLLERVAQVSSLRDPEAAVDKLAHPVSGEEYLRISRRQGKVRSVAPVGVIAEPTRGGVDAFLTGIDALYRSADPQVVSTIVYGGGQASDELIRYARRRRVNLISDVEHQGLIDFREYLDAQRRQLENDPIYRPELYVPQRISFKVGREERSSPDALEQLCTWFNDKPARFVLVLGGAGTGKTFLARQIALTMTAAGGPVTPILVELRHLEKGIGLDQLLAQHLARMGMGQIDLGAFRYMLMQGRIALLLDGFDELVQWVTHDRATEHLGILLQAAQGNAKVLVTSRTELFRSERQVRAVMAERLGAEAGHRIVHLHDFDEPRIEAFLRKRFSGKTSTADERLQLIREVRDLLGLTSNPRMLGFIAELPPEDMRRACDQRGYVTSAVLYQRLIKRWLNGEDQRTPGPRS